jgi:hypothetical protein
MNAVRIVTLLIALSVVAYLLAMLRARRIRERYVWLWAIMMLGLGVLAVFPGVLSDMAEFLGFQVASNLVLTVAAAVTFLVTVSLSGAVSDLQMSVRTLAEEVAFLKLFADQNHPPTPDDAETTAPPPAPTPGAIGAAPAEPERRTPGQ